MEHKTETTASIIRHIIQDALDNHELPDGSFAIEYVGDMYLDHMESRIAHNIHERQMDVNGKVIKDMSQSASNHIVISFTDGTKLALTADGINLDAVFENN